jgi:PTS system nitrogen regulatory IIA component
MDLRVRDVASLLNVSEQTVYRWVKNGTLPAHRLGDQFRFNRVELQEWAATHGHRVSPGLFAPADTDEGIPSLAAALERGGVHFDLPGDTREEVLTAVAALPGIPAGVDRDLLRQLLIARETLASTAIGNGIAVPHPRDPFIVRVAEPVALLCFLEHRIDFGAVDGRPVRVLVVLLSPSVRQHLQMLARLSYVLSDERMKATLGGVPPRRGLIEQVVLIEQGAASPPAASTAPRGQAPGRRVP